MEKELRVASTEFDLPRSHVNGLVLASQSCRGVFLTALRLGQLRL